jgi:hypothetical protein
VNSITSPFRVFEMELLAGEPNFNVEVVRLSFISRFRFHHQKISPLLYIMSSFLIVCVCVCWWSKRENNCLFRFDFREVYWNSRLQSEHTRLIRRFKSHDVICIDQFDRYPEKQWEQERDKELYCLLIGVVDDSDVLISQVTCLLVSVPFLFQPLKFAKGSMPMTSIHTL